MFSNDFSLISTPVSFHNDPWNLARHYITSGLDIYEHFYRATKQGLTILWNYTDTTKLFSCHHLNRPWSGHPRWVANTREKIWFGQTASHTTAPANAINALSGFINQESGIIYSGKCTIHAIYKRIHTVFIVHIDVGCWLLDNSLFRRDPDQLI